MRRNSNGFTIVELLVVVLVLGILAAIALPKFGNSKDKPRLAAVKSDVRNAELAEESYFSDHGRYGSLNQLKSVGLATSPGVTLKITASSSGYTIRGTDQSISGGATGCSVQAGGVGSSDGVITCP